LRTRRARPPGALRVALCGPNRSGTRLNDDVRRNLAGRVMSYFPDLSRVEHSSGPDTVLVGWLEQTHPYAQGETSREFRERLELLCSNTPLHEMFHGCHACEFCGRWVGWANIVVDGESCSFVAPTLVWHYVAGHNYRPPEEFITAVLSAPLLGSTAHRERYGGYGTLGCALRECPKDLRPVWNRE